HDTTTALVGESAAKPIMRLEIAENPGAAVKINDTPAQRIAGAQRPIMTKSDGARGPRQSSILDRANRLFHREHLAEQAHYLPRLRRREVPKLRLSKIG